MNVCPLTTVDIFSQNAAGEYAIQVRKDAVIVHTNGEKTNPVAFVSSRAIFRHLKCVDLHNYSI
jgi:hypothetical protein